MKSAKKIIGMKELLKLSNLSNHILLQVETSLNDGYIEYGRKITEMLWDGIITNYPSENISMSKDTYFQLSEYDQKLEHAKNIILIFIINLLNQQIEGSKPLEALTTEEIKELLPDKFIESYFDSFVEDYDLKKKYYNHGLKTSGHSIEKRRISFYHDIFTEMKKRKINNKNEKWSKVVEVVYSRYWHSIRGGYNLAYKAFMKVRSKYKMDTLEDFEKKISIITKKRKSPRDRAI